MKLIDTKGECIVHFYNGVGYVEHGNPLKTYSIYIADNRYYQQLKLVYDFDENDFSLYDVTTDMLVWIDTVTVK